MGNDFMDKYAYYTLRLESLPISGVYRSKQFLLFILLENNIPGIKFINNEIKF